MSLLPIDQETVSPAWDGQADLETLLHTYGHDVGEGVRHALVAQGADDVRLQTSTRLVEDHVLHMAREAARPG